MQLSSRAILAVTILAATGLASIGRTSPTKTPPVAIGPKTLAGFGGSVGFHEFLTQTGSSAGDIGGIAAPDTYWVYITGIVASGVSGPPGREIQFNLQETNPPFKHLGISLSIADPFANDQDFLECYQADGVDGVSTHILDPNNFSVNQDTLGLRFQFTKTSSPANWQITPYFRINGGAWTVFTDGKFTATQSFDFSGAKLRVGFVDGADGFIQFNNFFVVGPIRPPITNTYVDDDWTGSAFGDIVQFPGQFNVQTFGVTAFDSIQTGIDSLKTLGALGTVNVAPGNYVQSVFVDSLVHIIGSGSGDNPSIDTIVRAKLIGTSTFTIDGPAASGTSPSERFMMSKMRIMDAQGATFATGSGILVSATDTTRYMTFDSVAVLNNHCGISFGEATPGPGPSSLQLQVLPPAIAFFDMQILNSTFDSNTDAGILISSNIQEFDSLKISNCDITNNSYFGITGGQSGAMAVTNVEIDSTIFSGNGVGMQAGTAVASKSGLDTNLRTQGLPMVQTGDIHFVDFNGDASFSNVTVTGSDEPYGIQIRGYKGGGYGISLNAKTNSVPSTQPSGTVTFSNVEVKGSFDEVPLDFGAGLLIADYSDITQMSFSNVTLDVDATVGADSVSNLYFCHIDSNFSVSDTQFRDNLPGTAPFDIVNLANLAVDATSANFMGNPTPTNFDIEDRVLHVIDLSGFSGLVTWVPDNLYLTANSFVPNNSTGPTLQRAIDAATPGDTVNVSPETIMDSSPQLIIDRDLKIIGSGKGNTTLNPNENTGTIGDGRGWIVVNDTVNVNIQKMTLDGTGFLIHEAVRINGQASFDSVCFKEIKYNTTVPDSGIAVVARGDGPVNITNSTFTGIGKVGALYTDPDVVGSKFMNNTYTGKGVGVGDWTDIAVEITAGSIVEVANCTISENKGTQGVPLSKVSRGNLAPTIQSGTVLSSGILVSDPGNAGTAANIHDNEIFNSTHGIQIGTGINQDNFVIIKQDTLHDNKIGVLSLSALDVRIENSQIFDDTTGIFLDNVTSFDVDFNTIFNNKSAIFIQQSLFGNIESNAIHGNTQFGIQIDEASAATTITGNEFCNNAFGVEKSGPTSVDAIMNWWGASDGPSGIGGGSGDSVSVNVDFSSFKTTSIFPNSPCSSDASCASNGDVNNDTSLTPGDALCAFNIFLSAETVPASCDVVGFNCEIEASNVNCDGSVTPGDALNIFQRFLDNQPPLDCFAQIPAKRVAAASQLYLTQRHILQSDENAVEEELLLTLSADRVDGLRSFGLNLQFPAGQLVFLGVERTALTDAWTQLRAVETAPGQLILGGFNAEDQSLPTTKDVVVLRFKAIEKVDQTISFQVTNLVDDFANVVPTTIDGGSSDEVTIPAVFGLHQNYPNPFNPSTLIRFDLPADVGNGVKTRINIYNVTGQLVRTLLNEERNPGAHSVQWDGTNSSGLQVPSGAYFYRIKAGKFKDTKKMILLK